MLFQLQASVWLVKGFLFGMIKEDRQEVQQTLDETGDFHLDHSKMVETFELGE